MGVYCSTLRWFISVYGAVLEWYWRANLRIRKRFPCPSDTLSTTNSMWNTLVRTRTSAARSRLLTVWLLTRREREANVFVRSEVFVAVRIMFWVLNSSVDEHVLEKHDVSVFSLEDGDREFALNTGIYRRFHREPNKNRIIRQMYWLSSVFVEVE